MATQTISSNEGNNSLDNFENNNNHPHEIIQNLQITEGSITKKGSISQLSALSDQTELNELDFIWTGDAPIAEGWKQILEAKGIKVLDNEATLSDLWC